MKKRERVTKSFNLPSRTKQSFKAQCDVNLIMKRFKNVSNKDFLETYQGFIGGQFGDFSEVPDYRSALDQLMAVDEVFGALPAIVRKRFDNDPAAFLDFVHDPANADEMIKLGLANPKPVEPVSVSDDVSSQVS